MTVRIALVLAIVLGVIAAVGVRSYIETEREKRKEQYEPLPVVEASRRIQKGSPLTADDVKTRYVAKQWITNGMIPASDLEVHLGKIVTRTIDPNSLIFDDFLTNASQSIESNTTAVPENQRAVTIRVDPVSGVAGLIRPNDYVDIVGTFDVNVPQEEGGRATRTVYLMQAVRVLALDSRTVAQTVRGAQQRSAYRTVTLLLRPDDALRLINAMNQGRLQLILRNPADSAVQRGTNRETSLPTTNWNVIQEVTETEDYLGE